MSTSTTLGAVTNVTDYVANGSFESLRLNVKTSSTPNYAVLVRLVDHNNSWSGPFVHVDESSYEFLKKSRLAPGDVVVANVGANAGTVFRVPDLGKPVTLGPNAVVCHPRDDESCDRAYLYYFLSSPLGQSLVSGIITGSAQPKFNKTSFRQLPIALPGIEHQRAIAEVLGALDGKIAANTKLAKVSDELAVTLLSSSRPVVPLSGVVTHHKKTKNPESIGTAEVAHFSLPAFDAIRRPELTRPTDIKSSKFSIEQPSVLISKLNPRFPRVWDVAEVPDIPALASTEFLVLEPLYSSTTLLWAMLSQPAFGVALESKVAGTSGSHQRVKPVDLLDTPVLDPRDIPASLRDLVTSLGRRGSQARTESSTLTQIRDSLLPQLMSGKLRVKDAEKVLEEAGV